MSRRHLVVVQIAFVAVFLLIATQDRSGLRSRPQTEQVMQQLGVQWQYPGPPVIVLFGPGCGDCAVLQDLLNGQGIPYELVDVTQAPHAREALQELSHNRFGCSTTPTTPTTLVGTRVIRGPDAGAVVEAIKRQSDW